MKNIVVLMSEWQVTQKFDQYGCNKNKILSPRPFLSGLISAKLESKTERIATKVVQKNIAEDFWTNWNKELRKID